MLAVECLQTSLLRDLLQCLINQEKISKSSAKPSGVFAVGRSRLIDSSVALTRRGMLHLLLSTDTSTG